MDEEAVLSKSPDEDIDGFDNAEDLGGHAEEVRPWDPGKIRITTKSFTLREVVAQIEDDDIDLSPDFQREYVWKDRQRTRLIESILLGIPLPAFYFNQSESGKYQVVDGVQRLTTISLFMQNKHRLSASHLEYLSDLDGKLYTQLDTAAVRRFRSAQIVVHIIEPQTPDEIKYDIFNRVNTLGSPLSAQEIRHAMSGIRSREFVQELAESKAFDAATDYHYWKKASSGENVRDSGRMANRELALRFCAFRISSIEQYRQFASLDAFLMNFTKRIDGTVEPSISDKELADLKDAFLRAMVAGKEVLGNAAFRRWPLGADRRGPINRAVFEAHANALADYPLEVLVKRREVIVHCFRRAFLDQEYLRAVTVSTGDPNRVLYRLEETRAILGNALK